MITFHRTVSRFLLLIVLSVLTTVGATAQETTVRRMPGDSVRTARIDSLYKSLNDSARWNREFEFVRNLDFTMADDSALVMPDMTDSKAQHRKRQTWREKDSLAIRDIETAAPEWEPIPRKATIYALLFPGGGQIYNRKYWKLPIVYGGFVGCVYALTWNQSTYSDYKNAYIDIMDSDPDTRSYEDFLPPHYEIDTDMEEWLKDVFRNRKNKYRRYRDLSIFAFAGMYVVSAIDAYVDAELSHFDISPDLSMKLEPQILLDHRGTPGAGFSLALQF